MVTRWDDDDAGLPVFRHAVGGRVLSTTAGRTAGWSVPEVAQRGADDASASLEFRRHIALRLLRGLTAGPKRRT